MRLEPELRELTAAAKRAAAEIDSGQLVPGMFWDAVAVPLSKCGLWVDQRTELRGKNIRITTTLIDSDGDDKTIGLSINGTAPNDAPIGRTIARLELQNAVDLIFALGQATIKD